MNVKTYTRTLSHHLTSARDARYLRDWKNWISPVTYLNTVPGIEPFMLGCINRVNVLDHTNKPGYRLKVDVIETLSPIENPSSMFYDSFDDMLQVWKIE